MIRKMIALVAGAMLMTGVAATAAMATAYSPSQAQLLTYDLLHADNPQVIGSNLGDNLAGGVEFTAIMKPNTTHFGFAQFGNTYSDLDLSSFSSFMLRIINHNENPWNFRLLLKDNDTASTVATANTVVAVGTSATLNLDFAAFAGFNFAGVDEVLVEVNSNVPILIDPTHPDRTAEFDIAPVPEPGTMLLLGAGFLGLAIYGKRRKNA